MKPLRLLLLLLILSAISCKPKTHEELIVGSWKIDIEATRKGMPPGKEAPVEGPKDEMTITFYKDMMTQMHRNSSGGPTSKSGTYKLVHDGKYLDIMEEGREKAEEAEIVELSGTTMRIRIPDSSVIVFTRLKSK